jgi:hypothetical protein
MGSPALPWTIPEALHVRSKVGSSVRQRRCRTAGHFDSDQSAPYGVMRVPVTVPSPTCPWYVPSGE